MEKILTVVVPTYNMEKYLGRCLSSLIVKEELMAMLEVLVVNDGSKDRSSEIAHSYEARYPQTFRVIDKENGNYGSCVNRGLAEAAGKYIKILDADDWFTDNFQEFLSFLTLADVDMILNDFDFVLSDGTVKKSMNYSFPALVDIPLSELLGCNDMWMHAVTYNTDNIKNSGYTQSEGISYTDQEWIFFPMKTVRTFQYFNKPIYQYLQGREGQTVTLNVWLKHAKQEIAGAKKMLTLYVDNAHTVQADIRLYWEGRIRQRSEFIYQRVLLARLSFDITTCEIDSYDVLLRESCPQVYHSFDHTRVSPKIPYKYINAWRSHGYHRPFRLKLIVIEKRLRNFVLKVTGK